MWALGCHISRTFSPVFNRWLRIWTLGGLNKTYLSQIWSADYQFETPKENDS